MRRAILLVAAAAALLAPAVARAGWDQESMLQDDNLLLYSPPATVATTLDTLKALGVDRVRLTIKWSAAAPAPTSTTRPGFDANDPAAYPAGAWDRYDTVLRLAQARGVGVDFNVTGPAPLWATTSSPKPQEREVWNPSAAEFQSFVHALGTRYSGTYRSGGQTLPRVSYWSIWNEPNQPGWLLPQSAKAAHGWVDEAPRLYRNLVDGAYAALNATGHAQDTILIGETAPEGTTSPGITNALFPLRFIRELYCVSRKLRPLRGNLAAALGCPRNGDRAGFVRSHPDLFLTTGYAHHPYSLVFPPDYRAQQADSVGLADLEPLERTLDRIFRTYRHPRKLPIYLTEYGYQTKPPDPTMPFSTAQQASFLNEADFISFADPRVRTLSQFLLKDDAPNPRVPKSSRFYWSTFQSGLEFHSGRRKPSFVAYRLPIWLPRRHGTVLRVWGLLRPAANGARQTVRVVYRKRGASRWRVLRTVKVSSPRGSFLTRFHPPSGRGSVRISWNGMTSRSVGVRR